MPGSHRLREDRACGRDGSVNNPRLCFIRTATSQTPRPWHPHPVSDWLSRKALRRVAGVGAFRETRGFVQSDSSPGHPAGWPGLLQAGCASTRNFELALYEVERSIFFSVRDGVSCATHPAKKQRCQEPNPLLFSENGS